MRRQKRSTLQRVFERNPSEEAAIRELLDRMTVEEKVGQIIQADIASVKPDEVCEFNLGSILNGGGSAPGGDNRTSADQWLELADAFRYASTDRADGGVGIPLVWGTDVVHGHNNIVARRPLGRTYESCSEGPTIVAAYAPRIIEGIQGAIGSAAAAGRVTYSEP